MVVWLFRQLIFIRQAFRGQDTARQVAFGCALGMLLGLLPKGNLLAVFVSTLILCTRVNLGTAMVSTLAFSVIGINLDILTHSLGLTTLSYAPLLPVWKMLYRIPFVPWTSFNNTVVMGSLLVGLVMFYPVYRLSYWLCSRWRQRAGERQTGSQSPGPVRRTEVPVMLDVNAPLEPDRLSAITIGEVRTAVLVDTVAATRDHSLEPLTCLNSLGEWQRIDPTTTEPAASRPQAVAPVHWESTCAPSNFRGSCNGAQTK